MIILNNIGNFLIFCGLFTIFSISIHSLKKMNFNERVHILSVSDVFGIGLVILGLALNSKLGPEILKFLLLIIIIFITSPINCYIITKFHNNNEERKKTHSLNEKEK